MTYNYRQLDMGQMSSPLSHLMWFVWESHSHGHPCNPCTGNIHYPYYCETHSREFQIPSLILTMIHGVYSTKKTHKVSAQSNFSIDLVQQSSNFVFW